MHHGGTEVMEGVWGVMFIPATLLLSLCVSSVFSVPPW